MSLVLLASSLNIFPQQPTRLPLFLGVLVHRAMFVGQGQESSLNGVTGVRTPPAFPGESAHFTTCPPTPTPAFPLQVDLL